MSYSEISLSDIPDLHPVTLFSKFWLENKGSGCAPLRSSIEPTRIPVILPWMLLLEVIEDDGSRQYRYRLCGTGCRDIFGIDYTGKILGEDLTAEGASARIREFNTVVESGRPIFSSSNLPITEREFTMVFRGTFPVSLTGEKIDQVFVIIAKENMLLDPVRPVARPHGQQSRLNMR